MKCEYCNNEIQPGLDKCQACGAPVSAPAAAAPAAAPAAVVTPQAQPSVVVVNAATQPTPQVTHTFAYPYPPKSRFVYIILALFFGSLGVHNFYAKRIGSGVFQLLLTVLSFGFLAIISGLWALIEILAVDKDGNNVPFN